MPKPFSRVALAVGVPIEVPQDAEAQVLEAKRLELEQALGALAETAGRLLEVP